jgi:hypothetical protein
VADQLYLEWQDQWKTFQSTINGWSDQDIISTKRGQRSAEWVAAAAELTGRLSYLWARGAWSLSQQYLEAASDAARKVRGDGR